MKKAPPPFTAIEWASWLEDAERRTREVYKLSPKHLIAEYRREREITRGYHGREILELLQNAGDAARMAGVPGKVRIVVTSHGLVIGNTGRPFDEGGVQSLQTANLSPKRQRKAVMIGDKGLGFRSILNWTHSPLISSGKLGLAFLPSYAANVVRCLEAESADLAQRVANEQEIAGDLIVPRLAFPQWIPNWENHVWPVGEEVRSIATVCSTLRREEFDTAVGMPFSNLQAYQEALQQVNELKRAFLLLVDSIAQLEIQIEDQEIKTWSCNRSKQRCIIRENNVKVSSWTVSAIDGELPGDLLDHEERNRNRFQIIIAIPDEGQAGPGCLFCYFPTAVQMPLPLLAHATLELDETRKHLNDTRANRHILKVMAEQISELAEQQIIRRVSDGWDGCRMIRPGKSWDRDLEQLGFPSALKTAAKQKKLIPVLGGGHLSSSEARSAPGGSSHWWPSKLFSEIADFKNLEHWSFAGHLEVVSLSPEQALQRLLSASNLTIEERAYAIAGLIRSNPFPSSDMLATLLCDEAGSPLTAGVTAILQATGALPPLPTWATIRFLHPELRSLLAKLLVSSDNRDLQQKLRSFGVVEYSLSNLIRPVLAEANRQVRDRAHDESDIRGEALRFLWHVYQSVGDAVFPPDATLKLLNQEGNWADPKHLYLGLGYGQEGNVTQDLYAPWAKLKLVASPVLLGLDGGDSAHISHFLMWLGVERWPREIEEPTVDSGYLDAVKASLRYPVYFGEYRFDSTSKLSGAWVAGAKTLDDLPEILKNAPPEAVLAWLALDSRAVAWSRKATEHGRLSIRPYNAKKDWCYSGPIPNFGHWKIASTRWLPTYGDTKKPPSECLLGDRQLEVLFPRPAQPSQPLLERYGIASQVNDALRLVGVMPGLAQLSRDDIYRLLLEVPDLSPDGKAGRALCRWFVSNENYVFGSAGTYQEQFFRQGKVWGSKGGVSRYFPITELRYIDQEGFPPALTAKLAIADLPKRGGPQKVKDVLGIRPLERSEIGQELLSHRPSPELDNRKEWFDKAKPFIKRLRQTQSKQAQTIGDFERLSMVVCDELHIRMQYEGTTYEHTAQEGEWVLVSDHLYVRGDLDDSLDLLADAVGVAVASVFDMADGDAFAKILRCEPQSRGKLLKRMCGDDFNVELDAALANPLPRYSGPIAPPSDKSSENPEMPGDLPNGEAVPEVAKPDGVQDATNKRTAGVTEIAHVPQAPTAFRNLVIRNVKRTTNAPGRRKQLADGEKCEKMAKAFEEQSDPPRFATGLGHIMGSEAPGFDLVSFDSDQDREEFLNSETRDWSKACRFIEVKGRSSSTAKIDLKGNELKAARKYGGRYYLYRFYEANDRQYLVSILQNPLTAEEAKSQIIEIDLERANDTKRFEFIVDTVATDRKEHEAVCTSNDN